jgi:hypothetical protein
MFTALQRAILAIVVSVFSSCLHAAEPQYPQDVTRWQEVVVPPKTDEAAYMVWSYAANYSEREWDVFTKNGQPRAQLCVKGPKKHFNQPSFAPEAGGFHGASAFAKVDDGWLVGFNRGEFGAALYWFSRDGKHSYKISDHQVVSLFSLSGSVYAIEGLAHMGLSRGSVIRITRPKRNARWQAMSVVKLPFAPRAVSLRRDGTMLITLSDSLVSVSPDRKIKTLLRDVPWDNLYPNSSVLSLDEQKLYIGMRQFVAEYDLATRRLRLLVPSSKFLNRLPDEQKKSIRRQYGG